MKRALWVAGALLCASIAAAQVRDGDRRAQVREGDRRAPAAPLRPAASFDAIRDRHDRSLALFREAGKVLLDPRCVNCHPRGDSPFQGDDQHLHRPRVVRGPDDRGAPGLECASCHGAANFDPAGMPGHPEWRVAPASMAWQGRSLGAICRQIKDRRRNGGRDLDRLTAHMADDSLVGWAWHPGAGRTPAPGTQAEFGALIRGWVATGAACPR